MSISATVQKFQISKCLLLQSNQYSGNQLFVEHSITFQLIGHHIIDILNKDHICIQVIQIFDQCTMAARTEQQLTIITERLIIHIGSNCIRTRFLLRESYIIIYSVFLCINSRFICYQCFKQTAVFGRNCKMHIYFTILISCIERTLYKMFFQRCTVTVFISVEFQQTFRQCTVIQSCSFKQCSNYGFIVSLRHQRRNIFSRHLLTGSIQIIIESKFFNLFKECLFKFSFRSIIISSEKFEQILEHTARCA